MTKPVMKYLWALCALLSLLSARGPCRAAPVTLVVWGITTDDNNKADYNARIAAFERRHPEIKVSILSMGVGAMNPQKLMTAIVGGVPPDLVRQDRFTIGDWASRGAFRPLNDLLSGDAASQDPLAVHERDYVPATWGEAVYQNQVYAIPESTDDRVLYYNKTLFRKAGLDPDKPPQTWDALFAAAQKLTKRNPDGSYLQLGFLPIYGQGWLYLWSWQQDGEVMAPDGRTCTLNNPQTLTALQTLVQWEDALGGVDALNAFSSGWAGEAQDPFMTGLLAMKVDGDGFVQAIARYHPEMDFGVCPVPVPAERLRHEGRFQKDPTWVTWSGGFAYAVPRGARHVREAWEFVRWMNSPEAALVGARAQAADFQTKGRLYIPGLSANTQATKAVFGEFLNGLPPKYREAKQTAIGLLPVTRFRPVTFVGQRLWDEQVRAVDQAMRHTRTPEAALAYGQTQVQLELDRVYNQGAHPLLPTGEVAMYIGALVLAAVILLGGMLGRWAARHQRAARSEAWAALGFVSPWVIGFLVFTLGPIVASLILSFCDYDVLHPARWAGGANYRALATLDRAFVGKALGNALYLAAVGIPLGMLTSLSMALLLNTKLRGQHFYRTFFYVPSIVPTVATAVLWGWLLNADPHRGLLNAAWQGTLTHWFGLAPPGWLSVPAWAKPSLIVMGLWGAGGGMILWLAGLQAIPRTLYEAAQIDGAGVWAQFRHVTLPMLSPYIFFNLIIGTIGALQTFDSAYILGNTGGGQSTGPDDSLLVPVVYLFNNAFQYFRMGYASALAWLLFVLILGLTLGQLKLAPRWVHYETDKK